LPRAVEAAESIFHGTTNVDFWAPERDRRLCLRHQRFTRL